MKEGRTEPQIQCLSANGSLNAVRAGASQIHDVERLQSDLDDDDPRWNELVETPEPIEEEISQLTQESSGRIKARLREALLPNEFQQMVVVRGIRFLSVCEQHRLPFWGRCHVGYLASRLLIRFNHFPRIVGLLSGPPQVQERLTSRVADALESHLKPRGLAVLIEGQYLCIMRHGVPKRSPVVITTSMHGIFKTQQAMRAEFMRLIRCGDGN